MTKDKYQIIIADPPYDFADKLSMSSVKRGASSNYKTLSIQDIANLPINKLSDPSGCVLALWVPSALLQNGLDIMKSWGFELKQTYVWVKIKKDPFDHFKKWIRKSVLKHKQIQYDKFAYDRAIMAILDSFQNINCNSMLSFFMGHLFRQTHEICLIGINNTKIYKQLENKSQRSVCLEINKKHSAKPKKLHQSLELMFPDKSINKLELFARDQYSGWMCLGNEINGKDIRDAVNELIQ